MNTGTNLSPWLPFETRRRDRDAKREAVLRIAVQLFLEQGYHRATLNEVAERLNITKPAIYNYFRGKDEILFECWVLGQEAVFGCIAGIDAAGGTGLVKLRELIRGYAKLMTTDYGRSLVRFDIRDLSDRHAAIVRAAKRRTDTVSPPLRCRGRCGRLDRAVRCEAHGLRDRRVAELDRTLVPARWGVGT